MINRLVSLTKRNMMIFYRDRTRLIFSLLSPAIVIVLYEFFLNQSMIAEFSKAFSVLSLSGTDIEKLAQGWIISGALYLTTLSVAASSISGYSYDRLEKRFDDFLVSPITRFELAFSYVLSTMIITFMVTVTLYLISLLIVNKYLFFSWNIIAAIFIESLTSSALLSFFSILFIHSEGGTNSVVSLVNLLGGFFAGVYIFLGSLGKTLVSILECLPFAQGATLFRYQFMNNGLENYLKVLSNSTRQQIYYSLGISANVFGKAISIVWIQIIAISLSIILLALASMSLNKKQK